MHTTAFPTAFAFVPADHPFREVIESVNGALATSQQTGPKRPPTELRSLMRARRRDGSWRLKWLYVSMQFHGDHDDFAAETLLYQRRGGRIARYVFPDDPYLPSLSGVIARARGRRLRVLRYVPRRRLTFCVSSGEGALPLIGKAMRPADVELAYERLAAVSKAAARGEVSFHVPTPRGLDAAGAVLYQGAMPGRSLAVLLSESNYRACLHRVGLLHHQLHGLDVRGLRATAGPAFVQRLMDDLDWLRFFYPGADPLLAEVSGLLLSRVPPTSTRDQGFIHGDFTVSHVQADDESWSVVDFDDAAYGDRYAEIATFIARLKRDAPLFRDRFEHGLHGIELVEDAAEAYRDGYQERAGGALDEERLLWHRMCAEIHVLARLIKRDLVRSGSFDSALALIDDLRRQLIHARVSRAAVPMRWGRVARAAATAPTEEPW